MTGILNTALIGLFALSGASGNFALATTTEAPPEPTYTTYSVSMTGYNAVAAQTDGDPHITASGAYSEPDVVAARSIDLADELPYGTVIEVVSHSANPSKNCGIGAVDEYLGLRVIADSMHSRKRNQIDLLFNNNKTIRAGGRLVNPAVAFGICKEVEIRIVGKIDMNNVPTSQAELRLAVGQLEKAKSGNLVVSVGK